MIYSDILKLTAGKESQNVEFKKTTGQLDAGMETLCAFLNGNGGMVFFGVSDNGNVKGQDVGDSTKRDIAEAISRFEPMPVVEVEYVDVPESDDKKVIVLRVEAQHKSRPFVYRGRAFHRIESVTSVMSQDEYRYLFFGRSDDKYSWDRALNPELKISDLDEQTFWGAVRAGISSGRMPEVTIKESIEEILEKLELSRGGVLTNAAAILFGKQRIGYMQSYVRLARFRGTDKNEFIDNQQASGNIYKLLDDAMAFFFKHLPLSAKIEGLYREEELFIPRKALRECCINAFCHRRYDTAGSSVGIAIYDDRIEIESFGTLPDGITMEELNGAHRSQPRNRLIADTLYKTDLLENWGRGINLMCTECKRVGQPEPKFVNESGFFVVYFRYNRPLTTIITTEVTMQPTTEATMQVQKLVRVIKNGSLDLYEIIDSLGLKNREHVRKEYVKPALQNGIIAALYPDKPNHPNQKYYLTDKGHQLQELLEVSEDQVKEEER